MTAGTIAVWVTRWSTSCWSIDSAVGSRDWTMVPPRVSVISAQPPPATW